MKREELLSLARKELWAGWALSSEEIGSQAAATLLNVGMLVEPGAARELERLRVGESAVCDQVREMYRSAERENSRLRARLAELTSEKERSAAHTEHLATTLVARTQDLMAAEARVAELEGMRSALFVILKRGDLSETARREIDDLLSDTEPIEPRPSAEESADRLTRLFAPTQALRESEVGPMDREYALPLAPTQALREDEPASVPCSKCGDPVHWATSTNSDGGFWRHSVIPGRVLDHFGEVAGAEGRHAFEKEHQGESDAKRRLARCKHCRQERTAVVHIGTGDAR